MQTIGKFECISHVRGSILALSCHSFGHPNAVEASANSKASQIEINIRCISKHFYNLNVQMSKMRIRDDCQHGSKGRSVQSTLTKCVPLFLRAAVHVFHLVVYKKKKKIWNLYCQR